MPKSQQIPFSVPLELSVVAERLGQATGAKAVILFGSFARGEATQDSDVDLLYIIPDDADLSTLAAYAERALYPRKTSIDLVPMRQSHWLHKESPLARRAAQEGILLYAP